MSLKNRIEKIEDVVSPQKIPVIVGSSEEEIEEQKRKLIAEGFNLSGTVILVAEPHHKDMEVNL
jgi:hypothetical protein